jgi:hypothetical protein
MKRIRRILALLPFFFGVGLFIGLIHKIGPVLVFTEVRQIGWGVALLVLTCGARYFIRTLAWFFSIEPQSRKLSLFELFNIRLAGETFGELMIAGLIVGESTKAIAASFRLPGLSAYSSIFIENLLFGLSVVVFLAMGALLLCFAGFFPAQILYFNLIVASLLLICGLGLFLLLHRGWQVFSPLLNYLEKKQFGWGSLERQAPQIRNFEEAVYGFYEKHRRLFFVLLGLEFSTHWIGVFEAWWMLYWLQGKGVWQAAFLVESVSRVINSCFSLIPLRMGVDEGAMALLLRSIGYPGSVGISLAIVRKVRLLFWMVPGLFLIGKYSLRPRGQRSVTGASRQP